MWNNTQHYYIFKGEIKILEEHRVKIFLKYHAETHWQKNQMFASVQFILIYKFTTGIQSSRYECVM